MTASMVSSRPWRPTDASGFECIASGGFGDGLNAYAHVMAWHEGALYVGTTRANLQLRQAHNPPSLSPWPVPCPEDVYDLDLRAQIWRHDPEQDEWRRVHVAPSIPGPDGDLPRDIGYRGLVSFKGRSDPAPRLYVSAWSPAKGPGALVLRSDGNDRFEPASEPSLGVPGTRSLRSLVPFDGRLFTAPLGRAGGGGRPNVAERAVVLESDDPASGRWRAVSEPGFGDPDNVAVIELAVFADQLYAGTVNPRTGFQLWKSDAAGPAPYHWRRVLAAGAYRGAANEAALSLTQFGDALYVGTGIQGGGFDRVHDVGPAAAEIIRVFANDDWELVVGASRPTPVGFAVPASGIGPGFGNFFTGYVWRLCEHAGSLYAGTWDWSVFLPYLASSRVPSWFTRIVDDVGLDTIMREEGGADLWRSTDGTTWEQVTRTGFGNAYNAGIRTFASTPHGLFLGTANPFGPEVATWTGDTWTYVPNPLGGLEVWRLPSGRNGTRPRPLSLESSAQPPQRPTRSGSPAVEPDQPWGYWTPRTPNAATAAQNLVDELLALLPEPGPTVLDAACTAATTPHLVRRCAPGAVTAISPSPGVLEACWAHVPGGDLRVDEPTHMAFPDGSFATVICVEPPVYLDTHADFVAEAFRVLAPGGRLALMDVLPSSVAAHLLGLRANHVRSPYAYTEIFERRGFEDVELIDVTRECWHSYLRHRIGHIGRQLADGDLAPAEALRMRRRLAAGSRLVVRCVLLSASRPRPAAVEIG
jgi:SAM-dependent methyltransferase